MPEVRSAPVNATPTARAYQPFESAARVGEPPVTTGGVMSTWSLSWTVTVAEPSSALQNTFVPVVSVLSVVAWQPETTVASDGITAHLMLTSERNHPEQSAGAGVHL